MPRTGISYDDVCNAINAIEQDQLNPTVDRIREYLGTGSKSTIAPFLKQWRESKGQVATTLPSQLTNAVESIYKELQQQAQSKLLESKRQFEATTTELEQKLQQQRDKIQSSNDENTALQKQLLSTEATLIEKSDQIHEHVLELTELKAEQKQSRARIEDLQSANKERFEQLQNCEARLEKALQETQYINTAKQQLEIEKQALEQNLQAAELTKETLTLENQALSNEADKLQQENAVNTQILDKQKHDMTALEAQLSAQQSETTTLQTHNESLSIQLKALEATVRQLKNELSQQTSLANQAEKQCKTLEVDKQDLALKLAHTEGQLAAIKQVKQ